MRRALAILALLCVCSAQGFAQNAQIFVPATAEFPALTGRVVDDAGVLDASTREALRAKLQSFEEKTGDQIIVVTVKSLNGNAVEEYANRLFRHWRLGEKGRNNGVLLLHAPYERKIRIEVGYGLEGTLTDAISKLILANAVAPRFKVDDFNGGMTRGVDDIIKVLSGDEAFKPQAAPTSQSASQSTWHWPQLNVFVVILAAVGLFLLYVVVIGGLNLIHAILVALGLAKKRPRKGFWHAVPAWSAASSTHAHSWDSSASGSSGFGSSGDSFSGGGGGDSGGGGASSGY